MDFCFYHAADLHLDTPFTGLSKQSPELAAWLRDASLQAFDQLIERVLEDQAAFLLLAGDVYDGKERGLRAQLRVLKGLTRLAEAGIPTFMVAGNHDPLEGWGAIQAWPEGVHVFGHRRPERLPVHRAGQLIAEVQGQSFAKKATTDNLAAGFSRGEHPVLQVALLHANLGGVSEHDNYAPCSMEDLARSGHHYWALGHVHARQSFQLPQGWAAYPGNLQGRSPKPSERGAKGALRVSVRQGQLLEPAFVPLDCVRFEELSLDLAPFADLGQVQQAALEAGRALLAEQAGRSLLLRLRLEGASDVHQDLMREGSAEGLLAALRDASEGEAPWLWWRDLKVDSQGAWDPEALRESPDVPGELWRLCESLEADPAALRGLLAAQEGKGPKGAWQVPDEGALRQRLAEAKRLAMQAMMG